MSTEVLQDALDLAFLAGKAAEAGEDKRYDPQNTGEWRKEQLARQERLMIEAWEKLATLPGDVGKSAREEIKRIKWLQYNRID